MKNTKAPWWFFAWRLRISGARWSTWTFTQRTPKHYVGYTQESLQFTLIVSTLPETNSSHLKIDGWNTIVFFWALPIFRCYRYVSFREGSIRKKTVSSTLHHPLPWKGNPKSRIRSLKLVGNSWQSLRVSTTDADPKKIGIRFDFWSVKIYQSFHRSGTKDWQCHLTVFGSSASILLYSRFFFWCFWGGENLEEKRSYLEEHPTYCSTWFILEVLKHVEKLQTVSARWAPDPVINGDMRPL